MRAPGLKGAALAALVLLGAACDRAAAPVLFAPHEEGLTLAYENPQTPFPQRREQRLQVRVAKAVQLPGGALRVVKTFTTLQGETTGIVLLMDGAVRMQNPDGTLAGELLPRGFPDQIREWSARGRKFTVLGRAMAPDLEVELPPSFNRLGVWVESVDEQGTAPRTRTFFLPDVGEVETQEFRNGAWVSINRLVARGFTDAPPRPAF